MRAGHTEAGCDLAFMAGLQPSAVICEILKENGEMARLPDLVTFSCHHNLKIGTIADLIAYRGQHESLVERVLERSIDTVADLFNWLLIVIVFQKKYIWHLLREHLNLLRWSWFGCMSLCP